MPVSARHKQQRHARGVLGGLLCLALAGCGQTGPLYLPDDRGEVILREAPPQKTPPTTTQDPP